MPSVARMPPPPSEDYSQRMREAAAIVSPSPAGKLPAHCAVLLNNPQFLERWFGLLDTAVARSTLSDRDRTLVVMHLASRMRCVYAWAHARARDQLTSEELYKLTLPSGKGLWSHRDRALLLAAEETFERGGISSATWTVLSESHDQTQLYDLVMLLGFQMMTLSLLNSLGVPSEDGDPLAPWQRIDNGAAA